MDTTDKNIKKVLSNYDYHFKLNIEDSIMDQIKIQKEYNIELSKARKNAKTGILLSVFFLIVYTIMIYLDFFNSMLGQMDFINMFVPSIFMFLLLIVIFIILTFGMSFLGTEVENERLLNSNEPVP
ncbi:hypothetical protein [Parapedobacter tibetensis]|uniref:hypothetical protein n=1 Tax=Parapedobacter tibetensis TaxID=2972951 RepID=UPI00214D8235|nr:hypothetical protein [Parapedobacter tibetensis]